MDNVQLLSSYVISNKGRLWENLESGELILKKRICIIADDYRQQLLAEDSSIPIAQQFAHLANCLQLASIEKSQHGIDCETQSTCQAITSYFFKKHETMQLNEQENLLLSFCGFASVNFAEPLPPKQKEEQRQTISAFKTRYFNRLKIWSTPVGNLKYPEEWCILSCWIDSYSTNPERKENCHLVHLIFDSCDNRIADQIASWMQNLNGSRIIEKCSGYLVFQTQEEIVDESAIIVVSDNAVQNQNWQKRVRSLSSAVRIIPVGGTENADYSNPDVIPPKVEEINFISTDEKTLDNLYESLTLPRDFFQMRNSLLESMNSYIVSGRQETFLAPGSVKDLLPKREAIQSRLDKETDAYFAHQLQDIVDYLDISLEYAKKARKEKIARVGRRSIRIAFAVIVAIAAVWGVPNLKRAHDETLLLAFDKQEGVQEKVAAIKIADALSNPFIANQELLAQFNDKLGETLDENWSNSTIGYLDRKSYYHEDIAFNIEEHTVFTADTGGDKYGGVLSAWDYYTGKRTWSAQLTNEPLMCLDYCTQTKALAAVDESGALFVCKHDGRILKTPSDETRALVPEQCSFSPDGTQCAVIGYDDTGAYGCLYRIQDEDISFEADVRGTKLLACEAYDTETALFIFSESNSVKAIEVGAGKTPVVYDIDAMVKNYATCSLKEGKFAFASTSGYVYIWNRSQPDSISSLGICLEQPIALALIDNGTLVYNDRNTGTRLFDYITGIDLGSCFDEEPILENLFASEGIVAGHADGLFYIEEINDLLPQRHINTDDCERIFTSKADFSPEGNVVEIKVVEDVLLQIDFFAEGIARTALIDDSGYSKTDESRTANSKLRELPEDCIYLDLDQCAFNGVPTVVGILGQGQGFIFGTSDGYVYESSTFNDDQLTWSYSRMQVPTKAPIEAIYVTDECYYIKDSCGFFWKKRIAYTVFTYTDVYDTVRNKLHSAVSQELISLVSAQTAEKLNLVAYSETE